MSLDEKDIAMMAVSIPTVDYWEIREDVDRLEDAVNRLEKIVEALLNLYQEERLKTWELILKGMIEKQRGTYHVK